MINWEYFLEVELGRWEGERENEELEIIFRILVWVIDWMVVLFWDGEDRGRSKFRGGNKNFIVKIFVFF